MSEPEKRALVAYATYLLVGSAIIGFVAWKLTGALTPKEKQEERGRVYEPQPAFAPFPYDRSGEIPVIVVDRVLPREGGDPFALPLLRILGTGLRLEKADWATETLEYRSGTVAREELEAALSDLLARGEARDATEHIAVRLVGSKGIERRVAIEEDGLRQIVGSRLGPTPERACVPQGLLLVAREVAASGAERPWPARGVAASSLLSEGRRMVRRDGAIRTLAAAFPARGRFLADGDRAIEVAAIPRLAVWDLDRDPEVLR